MTESYILAILLIPLLFLLVFLFFNILMWLIEEYEIRKHMVLNHIPLGDHMVFYLLHMLLVVCAYGAYHTTIFEISLIKEILKLL